MVKFQRQSQGVMAVAATVVVKLQLIIHKAEDHLNAAVVLFFHSACLYPKPNKCVSGGPHMCTWFLVFMTKPGSRICG